MLCKQSFGSTGNSSILMNIYGALSEFIGTVVSQDAVTLLDINNSVPADMYNEEIKDNYDYT